MWSWRSFLRWLLSLRTNQQRRQDRNEEKELSEQFHLRAPDSTVLKKTDNRGTKKRTERVKFCVAFHVHSSSTHQKPYLPLSYWRLRTSTPASDIPRIIKRLIRFGRSNDKTLESWLKLQLTWRVGVNWM